MIHLFDSSVGNHPASDAAPESDATPEWTAADVDALRGPIFDVPSFVTADWLPKALNLLPAHLRLATERREEIGTISAFNDWPDKAPKLQEAVPLFLEGLRYPLFLCAFYRAAFAPGGGRKIPKAAEAFLPFGLLINALAGRRLRMAKPKKKTAARPRRGPGDPSVRTDMVALKPYHRPDLMLEARIDAVDQDPLAVLHAAWALSLTAPLVETDHAARIEDSIHCRRIPAELENDAWIVLSVLRRMTGLPLQWHRDVVQGSIDTFWLPAQLRSSAIQNAQPGILKSETARLARSWVDSLEGLREVLSGDLPKLPD